MGKSGPVGPSFRFFDGPEVGRVEVIHVHDEASGKRCRARVGFYGQQGECGAAIEVNFVRVGGPSDGKDLSLAVVARVPLFGRSDELAGLAGMGTAPFDERMGLVDRQSKILPFRDHSVSGKYENLMILFALRLGIGQKLRTPSLWAHRCTIPFHRRCRRFVNRA